MKCPYCGIELSDSVAEIHINSMWCKKAKETPQEKNVEKMNKDELLAKATELGITIENTEEIKKAQIIELIKAKETPQE